MFYILVVMKVTDPFTFVKLVLLKKAVLLKLVNVIVSKSIYCILNQQSFYFRIPLEAWLTRKPPTHSTRLGAGAENS